MSIIKSEQEIIKQKAISMELNRNLSIIDEIENVREVVQETRSILLDQLMFDYLTHSDERMYLSAICEALKIEVLDLESILNWELDKVLSYEIPTEQRIRMTTQEKARSVVRTNKRPILIKINEKYPILFDIILDRACKTADYAIGGVLEC